MRSRLACLTGTYLVGLLIVSAAGCGGDIQKPPDVSKPVDPVNDMPGYKDMQDKLKSNPAGKAR